MAVVDDGLRGERAEVGESSVHLAACTFEEAAAASDEERVSCEDTPGVFRTCFASNVIADGVLGVAWGCETSRRQSRGAFRQMKIWYRCEGL